MDTPHDAERAPRGRRLDSWKEIAAYLKRDIRTVQRWERQEGLPIQRHLHDERSTAYAYSGAIDEWLEQRTQREAKPEPAAPAGDKSAAPHESAVARRPVRALALGAIAVLVGAAIVGLWTASRNRSVAPSLTSLSVVFAASERIREWGPDTALSPDGMTLVYNHVNGQLNVRRLDQLTSRGLPGTEGSFGPFFSPDGRWIGFNRAGELMKVPVDGGAPVTLGVQAPFMGSADWGADNYVVYATMTAQGTHGLFRVPATGGSPQLISTLDGSADDAFWLTPQSLANGTVILCTLARTGDRGPRYQVVRVSVATGDRRVLVDDARHGLYAGDGVLVYWRNGSLFATRMDLDRLEIVGPHVPAWDGIWERVRMRSFASAAGTLVFWPTASVAHRMAWVDRQGKQELLPLSPAMYQAPRVSPDGMTIAYHVGNDQADVWTYSLASGTSVRMTTDGRSAAPLWTTDGRGLIFSRLGASGRDLARLELTGGAAPEPLHLLSDFLPGALKEPASWADGGRTLIVRNSRPSPWPALWAVRLDGSRQPHPVGPDEAINGRVSPDGRWVAYEATGSPGGRSEVYITSYPTPGQQWKLSTDGGALPIWSRSGHEVFYRQGDAVMGVPVTSGDTLMPGQPRLLFKVPWYEADPGMPNYDVAPGDERLIVVFPARPDGPERLNVIQGWRADIVRRLREAGS